MPTVWLFLGLLSQALGYATLVSADASEMFTVETPFQASAVAAADLLALGSAPKWTFSAWMRIMALTPDGAEIVRIAVSATKSMEITTLGYSIVSDTMELPDEFGLNRWLLLMAAFNGSKKGIVAQWKLDEFYENASVAATGLALVAGEVDVWIPGAGLTTTALGRGM